MHSTGPLRVCVPFDPGIDPVLTDTTAYTLWRDEAAIVPIIGETITWYTCRRLRRSQIAHLESTVLGEKARYLQAFLMGVLRADDVRGEGGVVRPLVPAWAEKDATNPAGKMTDDEAEAFDIDERLDIGHVIYRASGFFRPGRPVYWRPLDSSVDAVADLPYHHAGKIRETRSRQHAERLARLKSESESGSGQRTDATAKGDPSSSS